MEQFLFPSTVRFEPGSTPAQATLIIEPFFHGYGQTIGNALRRVLLSSLSGAAVTAVKIKGVQHEFTPIPGVMEDALEIILNLKALRLKSFSDEPVKLFLKKTGKGKILASDFEKNADVEVINPELVLATLSDENSSLEMEVTISRGRGFSPTETRKASGEFGVIAVDALFSPVRHVGIHVEDTRVGEITNYDRLALSIETDGSVTPQEATAQALGILLEHLNLLQSQIS